LICLLGIDLCAGALPGNIGGGGVDFEVLHWVCLSSRRPLLLVGCVCINYLHYQFKTRLPQLAISQPRIHPTKASAAYPKLAIPGYRQKAQASSYHSHSQIK